MKSALYRAVAMTFITFLLLGVLYPLATTWIGQLFFYKEATGSLITVKDNPVGSALIGQNFASSKYFHGRPSAAGDKGYDAANSSASNFAPTNKALFERMENSIAHLQKENPDLQVEDIPTDLVTTSGSGLDPHISAQSALIQIPRIAKARKLDENKIRALVDAHTEQPLFGFIGTEQVNVLKLNLALDDI
jgi:K+-transporting ATPase ATPase C chain